jgi:hypothetical protein
VLLRKSIADQDRQIAEQDKRIAELTAEREDARSECLGMWTELLKARRQVPA